MSQSLDGAGAGTPAPSHRSDGPGPAPRSGGPGPAWHRPVTLPDPVAGTADTEPMRRHRRRSGRLALLGGLAFSLGVGGIAAAWVRAPGLDDQAEIRIHFSKFATTEVVATAGVPITIVLANTDPIDHEWLVGDEAFHERHRTGTDQYHGARPTEVSLPAGSTVTTTVTFQQPGEYRFICHLPGHEAYGMVGILRVVSAD